MDIRTFFPAVTKLPTPIEEPKKTEETEETKTMQLSPDQQRVFDVYRAGHNVFVSGPGGTGKSALIRHIYRDAKLHGKQIEVTSTTGISAVLLQCHAKTIHSWAGIGLGNGTIDELVTKVQRNKRARYAWTHTDILVIDEVSMLSRKLFDLLNAVGKRIRRSTAPWGGLQLVCSGDFFQLPPISTTTEDTTDSQFCFESDDWNLVFGGHNHQLVLRHMFRQTGDPQYAEVLSQLREGVITQRSVDLLATRVGIPVHPPSLIVTHLYPTRAQVDQCNALEMSRLPDEPCMEYTLEERRPIGSTSSLGCSEAEIIAELAFLTNNVRVDRVLVLRPGAHVMCVINDGPLCNGSQGIVTGFCACTGYPVVQFNNGVQQTMTPHVWTSERIAGLGVSHIPLMLAWAITIHKCQGTTLDAASMDVGRGIFECGQTYVALSRVRSLSGLYLHSWDHTRVRIHPKVKQFYQQLLVETTT